VTNVRTAGKTAIGAALERLGALADEADREALAAVRDRLESARLRVLVAGEAKRGKSTLVNALLGREILPVGVTPLTAVATTVVLGDGEDIEVTFGDGRTESLPLSSLADYGTERGNPGNCRDVSAITVRADAQILAQGAEIVDTPGTGSVLAHNTAAADAALPSMDAAIFVLTADPPVSASERDLLGRVSALSVALFIVLNKADYLDERSLSEAKEFTTRVVGDATGRAEGVYALSARAALTPAGDPGFAAFASDLTRYLETGRVAGLERSVTRHARRIGQQLLGEVALCQRAARLPGDEAEAQIAAFRARLGAMTTGRIDAEDRANGQSRRLLEALNSAAGDAQPVLSADITTRMTEVLDGELGAVQVADVERAGRAELTRLVTAAAEDWRLGQTRDLEDGLSALGQRLLSDLDAELAAVRAAAADLLGLELTLSASGERLPDSRSFFYTLDEHVDQTELLAGAIRRRVPGEYGRRLARRALLDQVDQLIGSQIGRARGDLQYRLAEATRQIIADVRGRYAGAAQRLTAALDRASVVRAEVGHERDRRLAELDERERAIRGALGLLPGESDASAASVQSGETSAL
jgi:GTP-binding protein EngB required for normal cell division